MTFLRYNAGVEHDLLLKNLDQLLLQTYSLWDPGWVSFNWRGYTYDHVQRVRGLALTVGDHEGGDPVVTELAALLHDVTKLYDGEVISDRDGNRILDSTGHWHNDIRHPVRCNTVTRLYDELDLAGQLHNESGATIAYRLLNESGVQDSVCDRVAQTIQDHLRPTSGAAIESRCLYDADTIDANIGLPAFVRNIYINLHFHDVRKDPETPPIATLLRNTPEDYLRPYLVDNVSRWVQGKRRDFVPRLLTDPGRTLALARLRRLESTFRDLIQELDDFASNGHGGGLSVILHFMRHRDDPSIAAETAHLANTGQVTRTPQGRALIENLQREMAGSE